MWVERLCGWSDGVSGVGGIMVFIWIMSLL